MKIKIISSMLAGIIIGALNIVENRIKRIDNELVKTGLLSLLSPIRNVVRAISDENPENGDQIKEIFRKYANQDVADLAQKNILDVVDKIKGIARRPLSYLTVPVVDMLRILTDENPANEKQIEDRWETVLEDESFHEIVLVDLFEPVLERAGVDEEWRAFLVESLREALSKIGEGDVDGVVVVAKSPKTQAMILQLNQKLNKLQAA
jgi:hypothetical protein